MLPPEVRRGRKGDKCWPRDQSITESDDEGQKDEKKKKKKKRSERKMEGTGKGRSGVVTLRVPHCWRIFMEPLNARYFEG